MQFGWRRGLVVWSLVGCAFQASALAQSAPVNAPADNRWASSFAAFDAADRERAPATGGVVFVGSSSIRLWEDLETAFGEKVRVVKRGFGGSRLADCAEHVDRLVIRYQPRQVVVYAGDNDLAEGATPAEVAASFERLVKRIQAALPDTHITYVSIKPSPLRAKLLDDVRESNRRIHAMAQATPGLDYVDIFTPMLGDDGRPRADLYGPDALHMNAAGYALWRERISAQLR